MWNEIASEASGESRLWAAALKPDAERECVAVFSPLAAERFAVGLETIYEGYLVHYGTPRLFAPQDPDTALLLGAGSELDRPRAALRLRRDAEPLASAARAAAGDEAVERALAAHAGRVET